jgi:hypothetical protein
MTALKTSMKSQWGLNMYRCTIRDMLNTRETLTTIRKPSDSCALELFKMERLVWYNLSLITYFRLRKSSF